MTAAAQTPLGIRQVEQLLARARVYEVLARAFREPDRQLVRQLASGEVAQELERSLAVLPRSTRLRRRVARALAAPAKRVEEAARAYRECFVAGGCPPYEAEYIPIGVFRKMQQMADVAGFYRAFGLEMAPGAGRPDHVAAELEFMALLAFREAYAAERGNAQGASRCRRAQRVFLADHLVRWLPAFAKRVRAGDAAGLYGALAEVAAQLVLWEGRRFRVRVRPLDWSLASGPSGEIPLCEIDDGCPPCMEEP